MIEAGKIAMNFGLNDKMTWIDFCPPEAGEAAKASAFKDRLMDSAISLRYAHRLEKAVLDYRTQRVRSADRAGGEFLSGGRLLTIHWDQLPAESFLKQGDEYVHVARARDGEAH